MALTITSANSIYQLSITGLYNSPQQLQGFAADDVFDTPSLKSSEILMGVDGNMSAGFVYVPIMQTIHLQADSASGIIFDQWYAAQQAEQDVFFANAVVALPSIQRKWSMTKGVLSGYMPIPDAKKTLAPRTFEITWNFMSAAPF
jgi:hypothetical protein